MMVREGKKFTGPEQLREAARGCTRIRGDTLGIVGLGKQRRSFMRIIHLDIFMSIFFLRMYFFCTRRLFLIIDAKVVSD